MNNLESKIFKLSEMGRLGRVQAHTGTIKEKPNKTIKEKNIYTPKVTKSLPKLPKTVIEKKSENSGRCIHSPSVNHDECVRFKARLGALLEETDMNYSMAKKG